MPIDGTKRRYTDEPCHLLTMREDEPLHIPTPEDYYAQTGRVIIGEDFYHYFENSPFSLTDGPPPQVIGTFTWSGLYTDNLNNINVSQYFNNAVVANDLPYRAWRMRGMYRDGYMIAYYATSPPSRTPIANINAFAPGATSFRAVSGGWALGLSYQYQNLIQEFPANSGNFYFMGGPPGYAMDIWFPIKFQIEVGYGHPLDGTANRREGSWDWPAFTQGIGTDLLQYRGWNPTFACFNGLANAPNVDPSCPYRGIGGYTPPDPPEDL